MKQKPDDYYFDGIVEMARFGTNTLMKNHMTKEQHQQYTDFLKSQYEPKKKEIDILITTIKEKVVKCNPIQLLSFSSDMFLLNDIGISSEIQASYDSILISHMTEYIQSILVSTENKYAFSDEDQSDLFFEIQADIEKLYQLINEFYFSWGTFLYDSHPEYDDSTVKTIVESQFLYLVRGQRYQVYEFEYFEKLLTAHNDIFLSLYGITANDVVAGMKKLQFALSQGKFEVLNDLGRLFDSIDEENMDFTSPSFVEIGHNFAEKVLGTKLRDVIEVTGWSESFVDSLSYGFNEDTFFFAHPEFSGWPIIDLPIQKRPFIKIDNKYYCFDYYTFVDNFYRVIQKNIQRLNPEYKWADKQKEASEKMVADIFAQMLPGCTIYTDNYYPQNGSLKNPAENDIIIVYNDVMLIVEVKAGSFVYTPPFTDFENHIKSYKNLIEKADHQCKRTFDYLISVNNPSLYNEDKSYKASIDMSKIRDTYMLSVTIDNINDFAARAEKLSFLKLKCNAISISVDDLMVYRDYFNSPLLFLHFLKQRRQATQVPKLAPNDELDHLGLYIKHNCYYMQFDDTPENTSLHLVGFREDLDKYFSALYHPRLKPEKPQLKLPDFYKTILEYLTHSSIDNKVEISNYLLDFDTSAKEDLCEKLKTTFYRQRDIRGMSVINTSGTGECLRYTCFVNQPSIELMSDDEKREYVLSAMLWNQENERVMLEFTFDEACKFQGMKFHRYQLTDIKDDEKDCLYEKGKQRAERLIERHRTLISKKIGRNEPCPCGSGKKYKKCCGSNKN